MDAAVVRAEVKSLLVEALRLEGRDPSTIDDDAPLFGEGSPLSLDSLDALELAMAIEERFGVKVPEGEAARPIFRSVAAIADHVAAARANGAAVEMRSPGGAAR